MDKDKKGKRDKRMTMIAERNVVDTTNNVGQMVACVAAASPVFVVRK